MAKESKHVIKFRKAHLKSGEKIKSWGPGYIGKMFGSWDDRQHDGVLIVTNERVAFYRKGFLGEIIETMPLKKITSVERKSLLGHRTIRIHTSHDELEFKTFEKEKEKQLVDSIEANREEQQTTENPTNQIQNKHLNALKKLGELKKLGVITEDEFNKKKMELLDKI